ncbi:MAG TPA: hypothetical protein EYP59_16825 [Thiotrichaceae bacterium]|nr:hypothetical protein [Thiotrichaceae bacterium]
MRVIELIEYNPVWRERYDEEVNTIRSLLGKILIKSHHIGSTAIPEMAAKPIIDILLEVTDVNVLESYDKHF